MIRLNIDNRSDVSAERTLSKWDVLVLGEFNETLVADLVLTGENVGIVQICVEGMVAGDTAGVFMGFHCF